MTVEEIYKLFLAHPKIETDSRNISGDSLFFALKGENFNGNHFASEALQKGAAFAIIDEKEFKSSEKTILVENVLKALQELAALHRRKLKIPIVAITGTNGKTTTKELISAVLDTRFNVSFTKGNLNNHIGVPLTLLQMNNSTEIGVIEMGANHPFEIGELCAIADPDYGIITNIGLAHLQGFGSFETIKRTKAELYTHIKNKQGIIFYNGNNPVLQELVGDYPNRVSYGDESTCFSGSQLLSPPYLHVKINFPGGALTAETQLTGSYNFENIMAAACVGSYFKIEPAQIQSAIQNYMPQNHRSQLIEKGNLKIIVDAYNANPTNMKAAIESFVKLFNPPRHLILGDMLELGEHSLEEHITILRQIKKHHFEVVLLAGPAFKKAAGNFGFPTFDNVGELCRFLKQNPVNSGAILIKGSRGMQLEKVLEIF